MPLTIAQALKDIPALQTAKVVAGEQNLDQPIRWTHIIDHPDILPFVQEGHLLLTTAFALMINPESQSALIASLAEKKLCGMMVNVGRYMGEIPTTMVSAAQKVNFPLIALPWEVNFTDVTYAIHERIINEQYALSEQVFHIHEVLTRIVIEGGGLDTLAEQLASLLKRPITIEDASLSLLAYHSKEPIDNVRERSIIEGHTPAEIYEHHTSLGLYERLREERRPLKVEPVPELGMTLERVVAPITVGDQLLGYIWVIATDHPLTELDFLVIERGANLAALILSREQAVYEAEQRVKNKWFENLLDPKPPQENENISESLTKLGLAGGFRIMVIEGICQQPMTVQARLIERCLMEYSHNALILERGGRLVVILSPETDEKAREIGSKITERGAASHCSFAVGISSQVNDAARFRLAYEEALNALRVGCSLSPQGGVWSSDSLGYILNLLELPDEQRQTDYYHSLIARIAAYDEKHETSLLKTLEAYIDQLTDIQKTANALFIHRNTLYQRLEKISDLCHIDLKDTITILNLYLALKDWKLIKQH